MSNILPNLEDNIIVFKPYSLFKRYSMRLQKVICENIVILEELLNSFSAKGNIELFANNTDSGESARNELSHLKSSLFGVSFKNIPKIL